ncbi:hypothetical protein BDN67DRAFT_985877, partial [Paxillus ammoniavirescens]
NPAKKVKVEPVAKSKIPLSSAAVMTRMDSGVSSESSGSLRPSSSRSSAGPGIGLGGEPLTDIFKQTKWRRELVPTLVLWAGAQCDVWNITKQQIIEVLNVIMPVVYVDQPHLIGQLTTQSKAVAIAYQRLCEWCHGVGSAAIALFTSFFAGSSLDDVKTTTDLLLDHLSFLYEDLDSSCPEKAFRSQFVVQLLATTHLPTIRGFIHIPALDTISLTRSGVKGITGLCCAAVAFHFFFFHQLLSLIESGEIPVSTDLGKGKARTPVRLNKAYGKESTAACAFSKQNWGSATRKITVAAGRRSTLQLSNIMELARISLNGVDKKEQASDGLESGDEYDLIFLADSFFTLLTS